MGDLLYHLLKKHSVKCGSAEKVTKFVNSFFSFSTFRSVSISLLNFSSFRFLFPYKWSLMRVGRLKRGSLFEERMRNFSRKQLLCPPLSINDVINNHLVPNSASLFGHFDNRISVPYRIKRLPHFRVFYMVLLICRKQLFSIFSHS